MGAIGRWALSLDGAALPDRVLVGGKAWGIATMRHAGLPVPPAFVVTTEACRAYLAQGALPDGLLDELYAGIAILEAETGRRFGAAEKPLLLSIRSGAVVSMPGMLDTVLNLGIDEAVEAALAVEAATPPSPATRAGASTRCTRGSCSRPASSGFRPSAASRNGARPSPRRGLRAACQRRRPNSFSAPFVRSSTRGTVGVRGAIAGTTGSRTTRARPSRFRPWCSATSAREAGPASSSPATRSPARLSLTASIWPVRRVRTWSPAGGRRRGWMRWRRPCRKRTPP